MKILQGFFIFVTIICLSGLLRVTGAQNDGEQNIAESIDAEKLAALPLDTIAARIKGGRDNSEKRPYISTLYHFKPRSEKDIATLVNLATEDNGKGVARDAALRAIDNVGPEDKDLEPVFLKMLDDKRPIAQFVAMKNCGRLKSAKAKPILLKRLRKLEMNIKTHDDIASIEGNTSSLALYGKEILPDLLQVAKKASNKDTIKFVSGTMKGITDKGAVPAFMEMVKDKSQNPEIRGTAIEMVGKLGAKESLAELTRIYKEEKDSVTRYNLISSIGDSKSETAVPFLQEVLNKDQDESNRAGAAHALEKIGGTKVISILEEALKKEEYTTAKMGIAYSLKQLTGKDYECRKSGEK